MRGESEGKIPSVNDENKNFKLKKEPMGERIQLLIYGSYRKINWLFLKERKIEKWLFLKVKISKHKTNQRKDDKPHKCLGKLK